MTRRRRPSLGCTILLGLGLMPFVCALAFFGLVLTGEAMGLGSVSMLEAAVEDALEYAGLAPAATALLPEPSLTPLSFPTPTQTETAGVESLMAPSSPSPTPSLTLTPSTTPTASLTTTTTATATSTPTLTLTPSATASSSATLAASRTRTPTRTPTHTASASPSSSATSTSGPTLTPTPTLEGQPGSTPTPGSPPTETSAPPSASPTPTAPASSCDASANAGIESQVIGLVNAERTAQGLAAYTVDSRLTAAARVHATDMACNHFTSHTGSDGSSVRDRVERQGYTWSWIGENYFVGGGTAQTAFNWWMNSTPHRANLLSPNYTQFGVGYVYDADSDYGGYFVIVFARPG